MASLQIIEYREASEPREPTPKPSEPSKCTLEPSEHTPEPIAMCATSYNLRN